MAHFTLIRANLAAWVGVTYDTEWWAFDQRQFKSINGDDGGTWAPAAVITIGGSGLELTSATNNVTGAAAHLDFLAGACCNFGDAAATSILSVQNASYITWTAGSHLDMVAGTADFETASTVNLYSGNVTVGNGTNHVALNFAANTTSTFQANAVLFLASGSELETQFGSTASLGGATSIGGTPTLSVPMVCNAVGRVVGRPILGLDADHTYNIGDADEIVIQSTGLSADRAYLVGTIGAQNGDKLHFSNLCGSFKVTINWGSGTQDLQAVTGRKFTLELTYIDALGAWLQTDWGMYD